MVTRFRFDTPFRDDVPDEYREVITFGKKHTVPTSFMNAFHAACREFDNPRGSRDKDLINYVERKLERYWRERRFLLAGYVNNFDIGFTHIERTKKRYGRYKGDEGEREYKMQLKPERGMGAVVAPWAKADYVIVLYQPRRLPVGVVEDIYPEERVITCAASYQSEIGGRLPKGESNIYTLEELFNAVNAPRGGLPMVTRFDPTYEGYEKLDPEWYIPIEG